MRSAMLPSGWVFTAHCMGGVILHRDDRPGWRNGEAVPSRVIRMFAGLLVSFCEAIRARFGSLPNARARTCKQVFTISFVGWQNLARKCSDCRRTATIDVPHVVGSGRRTHP
jgi:hypothetical protein